MVHPPINESYYHILKNDIENMDAFKALLELYDLHISSIEVTNYIIAGLPENIDEFRRYWMQLKD